MSHRCCWRRAAGSRKRAPATEARQKCVRGLPELSGNTSLGHVERKGDVARDPTSPALRAVPLASRASRVGLISSPTFLGRLAQRESVSLTRRRSQVQILYRPPQVRAVLRPEKVVSKLPGSGPTSRKTMPRNPGQRLRHPGRACLRDAAHRAIKQRLRPKNARRPGIAARAA